jgi:hypothetical protein
VDPSPRRLTSALILTAAVVAALIVPVSLLVDRGVAPTRQYVAPAGDDRADCTRSDPCASLQRALDQSEPGSEIRMAGGVYPAQTLSGAARRGSKRVVIRPAGRTPVRLKGELTIAARNLEVRDLTVAGWTTAPGASHVTMRDVHSTAGMFITSADHIHVLGGSVGPGTDYSPEIKAAEGSRVAPSDVLIDDVTFHDWTRNDKDSHVDCLHVMAADDLVIRNSRFRNCEAFALLFTSFGDAGSPRHVVVEDNDLGCCRSGFYSLRFGAPPGTRYRDVVVRDNRVPSGISIDPAGTTRGADVRVERNVGPGPQGSVACALDGVRWDACPANG